jgi:hypothetical protein
VNTDVTTAANPLASLTVNGTLTIGNNNTRRNIYVGGNITVTGNMSVSAGSNPAPPFHALTVGGNITNTGTINLATDANSLCNVTFNRNGNQTVSGAGAYTFNRITLDMGASRNNILDMQSAMTAPANFLTISDGTYRHSNTSSITPWTANTTIGATGGFWLNAAAAVTANMNLTLNGGQLRITDGTFGMAGSADRNIILNNAAATLLQMEGGTLSTTGGIVSSSTTAAGTFDMSGGTINLTLATGRGGTQFLLGSNTTFTMAGGTIFIRYPNDNTYDIDIRSGTQTVSGGTVQLGDTNAGGPAEFWIRGASTLNVWNLIVGVSVARTTTLFSPLNVFNDLAIGTNNTLDVSSNSYGVAVGGGNASGDWINNGVFNPRFGTVTLLGTGNSNIAGASANTFYNLTVNKTAPATGVTIANAVDHTVTNVLTLTEGIVITPAANVLITTRNCNAGAVSRTNGWVAGSLQKRIPASGSAVACSFEIGDTAVGSGYRPVDLTFSSVGTAGSVTGRISQIAVDHPDTVNLTSGIDPAKSVNRFWTLTNSGAAFPSCDATFNYLSPGDWDAASTPTAFIPARGMTCSGTDLTRTCSGWSFPATGAPGPNGTQTTATALTAFGDFAVGQLKPPDFSRERQFIYTRELY